MRQVHMTNIFTPALQKKIAEKRLFSIHVLRKNTLDLECINKSHKMTAISLSRFLKIQIKFVQQIFWKKIQSTKEIIKTTMNIR